MGRRMRGGKKTVVLAAVCAAGISCLLTGCKRADGGYVNNRNQECVESSSEDETVLFRLAETMPEDHPSARTMKYFADLVEKESGGTIKIRVYYDEDLGSPAEILEQMKFGGIAMARVNSLELSEAVPSLQEYMKPQNYTGPASQIQWFHKSEDRLRNECQREKITPLTWYYPDLRCIYSSSNPIGEKADLKGTKVKTSDCHVMHDIMKEMGAKAVVGISSMDVYRLLSSGDVQYGESGFCEFICRDFGKYIHYVRITDYAYFPDVLLINTDSLNGLAPDKKEILESCAEKTYEYQKAEMLLFKRRWTEILDADEKVDFKEEGFY